MKNPADSKKALAKNRPTVKKSAPAEPKYTKKGVKTKQSAGTAVVPEKAITPARPTAKAKAGQARKKPLRKAPKKRVKTLPGADDKKASQAGASVISQLVARRSLPEEYGENEVILMPVDPNVIFVDWEIKKEEIPEEDTSIIMRVSGAKAGHATPEFLSERPLELRLESRTGSGFFDIGMPGRDVVIEIGIHFNGIFSPILKSPMVSMPEPLVMDEPGIAQGLFESGFWTGY